MYTSAIDQKRMKKAAVVFLCITAFMVGFNYVYTSFSYGESSDFMRYAFFIPLILGAIPYAALFFTKRGGSVGRVAFNLWNSAVAILTVGCVVRGAINISGRFTDYDVFYWIGGGGFLVMAVIAIIARNAYAKKHTSS